MYRRRPGQLVGAILAAFIIGFLQIIAAHIQSHFQMVVALLAIIITLILKPSGLFGRQKELEERVLMKKFQIPISRLQINPKHQ